MIKCLGTSAYDINSSYYDTLAIKNDSTINSMKLGKALRLVLSRWDMSPYRLAKASGVGQATIGKLIKGEIESSTWDVVERLADGFGRLDRLAKAAFLAVLSLPDSDYPDGTVTPLPYLEEIEKPENISKVLAAIDKLGLLNREAVRELEQRALPVEQRISVELQQMRAEESDQDV